MPECRTVRHMISSVPELKVPMLEPVWYRNKNTSPVPDRDDECQTADTGGISLDADAQLCVPATPPCQGRSPAPPSAASALAPASTPSCGPPPAGPLPRSEASLPVSATSGFSSLQSPALPPFVLSLIRAVFAIGN
jgi:hypothetical protein